MNIDIQIEVTVKQGDSSTQRGNLLETLVKRVLLARQYLHVSTAVLVTGCELDVVAQDKQTGSKILVECKAYRDKVIDADILTKLMGNLTFNDEYKCAWLITTSRLGKAAKGLVEKLRTSPDKREKLLIWDSTELVELLISTGQVVSPNALVLPSSLKTHGAHTLCITDIGEYWAVSAIGPKSGVTDTVLAFDAKNGMPVTNNSLLQQLNLRDSNLKTLQWVPGGEELMALSTVADASLRLELDSIAPVPVADDWSDYRPARPADFVGRDELLFDIVKYFDEIREGLTSTRLLAIKAPSGWGKSSFLVKLKSVCQTRKNAKHVFLYAVDCRTASSSRYPELALKRCFDEAVSTGFVNNTGSSIRVSSAGQPFIDPSIQSLLKEIKEKNKLIVLFFDQFEEITTKQELSDLFIQIKMLCAAVESASENVVLGFSWKTDGSIPTDHPAYHAWHSFADRRREFELPLFSKNDISKLLTGLSNQLNAPIESSLRRLLTEHCQGYPWLLKKLCVHVFRVLQSKPDSQRQFLARALDVEALFKKDLANLDHLQIACLEHIARLSPADHFKVTDRFADAVVDSLIQQRLVVRSSGKLILYWDIFRDFVLSKLVPEIPASYIPVSSPATARLVIEACATSQAISKLSSKLNLGTGTLDNVARDLVMMGVCEYDRKKEKLKLLDTNLQVSLAALFKFFSAHMMLRRALDSHSKGFRQIPLTTLIGGWVSSFATENSAEKTKVLIARRMVLWFQSLGIFTVDTRDLVTHRIGQVAPIDFTQFGVEGRRGRGRGLFLGETSPRRVLDVIAKLRESDHKIEPTDRNALYVLKGLRLVTSTLNPVLLDRPKRGEEEMWLAFKVLPQQTVQMIIECMRENPLISGFEIDQELKKRFAMTVSDVSLRRYSSGISVWVKWLENLQLVNLARSGGLQPPSSQV